jgi:hypothetical protein
MSAPLIRLVALAALVGPGLAVASVGRVTRLQGEATRIPRGAVGVPLAEGAAVELGDTLQVKPGGALKFELTDGSVIALAEKSTLTITEAEFEGQERKGFSGLLRGGSLWTKVKKALGGGKFEVTTERAVAGVRGTIFRIDADTLVKAASGGGKSRLASIIRVVEGVVVVHPAKAIAGTIKAPPGGPGKRVAVAGPREVGAEEWEARFVELQKNSQIAVGVDLWEQSVYDQAARRDAFAKWLEKNP